MNELQAIALLDRIKAEAPYLSKLAEVHKLNHIEYVCRIKQASDKPFYVWDTNSWREVRALHFGVRERVEAEV